MTILISSSMFAYAYKSQASLSQCQYLKDQVDYYTELRRKGGSARRMEYWRDQRREYQEEYDKLKCHFWRRKLS